MVLPQAFTCSHQKCFMNHMNLGCLRCFKMFYLGRDFQTQGLKSRFVFFVELKNHMSSNGLIMPDQNFYLSCASNTTLPRPQNELFGRHGCREERRWVLPFGDVWGRDLAGFIFHLSFLNGCIPDIPGYFMVF